MTAALRLYNTATRCKEPFSAPGNEVHLYACGPTVYNYAHIGNLRTYLFEDVLRRTLDALGFSVNHIVNITDVGHLTSDEDTGEDKMEKGALREGKTVWDVAQFYTRRFMEDCAALNIRQPVRWCRATDHIAEMIALISKLEENGYTYRTSDGVYFDTSRFAGYGRFAGIDADTVKAGIRVDMGEKRHPTDFALWKVSPPDSRRQMEWDSPWGLGFPGWHIECSAMSLKYLRQPLDIHCGGIDHIRVHHSNEIAQVEAATGKPFCRFWMHGEFLVVDKAKMAKSGDTFVTLETVRTRGMEPLAYRYFSFLAHYRTPLSFSWEGLESAAQGLRSLRKEVRKNTREAAAGENGCGTEYESGFWEAVCDDLNMPRAVATVWDLLHDKGVSASRKLAALRSFDAVLGLDLLADASSPACIRENIAGYTGVRVVSIEGVDESLCLQVAQLAAGRKTARAARDYQTADSYREQLVSLGVTVRDLKDGTIECCIGTPDD